MPIRISAKQKQRMAEILHILAEEYTGVKIQLDFRTPHQLLVATILSAQCTDARVNTVTKELFQKYRKPVDFLLVPVEELEQDIYSTGFYKAKAKNIRGATQMINDEFGGVVPGNMLDLLRLPGVGRKTANVLLGHCFNTPGIVVDTHVIRISNRLDFVDTKDAVKIEFALMKLIPEEQWVTFTHFLINHGRKICTARKPKCIECQVHELCPRVGVE